MIHYRTISNLIVASLLVLAIGGCAALDNKIFGQAETGQQRAWRGVLIYAGQAAEFAEYDLEELDQAAYSAVLAMKAVADAGGDVGAAAKPVKKALRKYAARAGIDFGIAAIFLDPSIPGIVKKLVKEGGALAVAAIDIRNKVGDLVDAKRDPTAEEWAEALAAAKAINASIQE